MKTIHDDDILPKNGYGIISEVRQCLMRYVPEK